MAQCYYWNINYITFQWFTRGLFSKYTKTSVFWKHRWLMGICIDPCTSTQRRDMIERLSKLYTVRILSRKLFAQMLRSLPFLISFAHVMFSEAILCGQKQILKMRVTYVTSHHWFSIPTTLQHGHNICI